MNPFVYIATNNRKGTFYVGVTSNLPQRAAQHRIGAFDGFSKRHSLTKLVWFEAHDTMETAITREKQIKRWRRDWKIDLIEDNNPGWRDLYFDIAEPQ